jgi:hypothetical protein
MSSGVIHPRDSWFCTHRAFLCCVDAAIFAPHGAPVPTTGCPEPCCPLALSVRHCCRLFCTAHRYGDALRLFPRRPLLHRVLLSSRFRVRRMAHHTLGTARSCLLARHRRCHTDRPHRCLCARDGSTALRNNSRGIACRSACRLVGDRSPIRDERTGATVLDGVRPT